MSCKWRWVQSVLRLIKRMKKIHLIAILLFLLTLYILGSRGNPSKDKNLFWIRTRDGRGFLPAFLTSPFQSLRAKNESSIKFYLNTKANPVERDLLILNDLTSIKDSHFIPGAPIKLLIHGFAATSFDSFPVGLNENFLKLTGDVNLISVDWTDLAASPWYDYAARWSKRVGELSGELLHFFVEQGLSKVEDFHLIGFSLGCHAAGVAGSHFRELTGRRVLKLTGLDPALPLFGDGGIFGHDELRIDPEDSEFTDVIHAAGGMLIEGGQAFVDPRGHVDFYPNSGKPSQPGCEGSGDMFGGCSHQRAHQYYAESILNPRAFASCKCDSWEYFDGGVCRCSFIDIMGYHSSRSSRGKFYCRTNNERPYSLSIS